MPKLKDGTITPYIAKVIDLCARDSSVKNDFAKITADGTTFKATNSIFDKSSCDVNTSEYFIFNKKTTLFFRNIILNNIFLSVFEFLFC